MQELVEGIEKTNRCAIAISDGALLKELSFIASSERAFVCPEGTLAFAAAPSGRWLD
ncbi:hypothetical protein [Sporosarcina sp. P34]|uniref:hypothetical protein n=1 Tax=Sporosarcina sp. P34 TaxID=2048247 RepID=UPI0013040D7E|nr:hypothetical protein [Sporosarcina sp. P34]